MQNPVEQLAPARYVPSPLDLATDPDGVAAWTAETVPSAESVSAALRLDASRLSHDARVDALVGLERSIALLQARQQRLLAAMAHDPVPGSAPVKQESVRRGWIREEVACALRLAPVTAGHRLSVAMQLVERLPATLTAFECGRFGYLHARTLADDTIGLGPTVTSKVEARVLPRASEQSVGNFARSVERAIASIDPRPVEERHEDRMGERRVVRTPQPDGMAELWALLPADGAAQIMTALDALGCRVSPADPRTSDQLRADALVAMACDALHPDDTDGAPRHDQPTRTPPSGAHPGIADDTGPAADTGPSTGPATSTGANAGAGAAGSTCSTGGAGDAHAPAGDAAARAPLPRWQRQHPAIHVTVALSTLLGLDDQPSELAGHGPIPASLARRLAADPSGTWRRLLTDEHGRLLDYGRCTYRPPKDLVDFVIARDETCRFPHCNRAAVRCQLDHREPWEHGGTTCPGNLQPLCLRHHTCKHDAGWQVQCDHDTGTTTWTSPTGHHYDKAPPELPIDHTTELPDPDPPPF